MTTEAQSFFQPKKAFEMKSGSLSNPLLKVWLPESAFCPLWS